MVCVLLPRAKWWRLVEGRRARGPVGMWGSRRAGNWRVITSLVTEEMNQAGRERSNRASWGIFRMGGMAMSWAAPEGVASRRFLAAISVSSSSWDIKGTTISIHSTALVLAIIL